MKSLLTALTLSLAAFGALADTWPAKPVSLVVPFPPGGSSDMIARTLATKLQDKLGGSFVVENKAGAGGTVGSAAVKTFAGRRLHPAGDLAGPAGDRPAPDQGRGL